MKYEWRYDNINKTGYLKLSSGKVDSTIVAVDGHVMFDKDKRGNIIGVEILLGKDNCKNPKCTNDKCVGCIGFTPIDTKSGVSISTDKEANQIDDLLLKDDEAIRVMDGFENTLQAKDRQSIKHEQAMYESLEKFYKEQAAEMMKEVLEAIKENVMFVTGDQNIMNSEVKAIAKKYHLDISNDKK